MGSKPKTRRQTRTEEALQAIDEAIVELQMRRRMLTSPRRRPSRPPRGYIINPKTGQKDWYLDPGDPRLRRKGKRRAGE